MDLRLDILPADDTTPAEVARLTDDVRAALERAPAIDRVETPHQAAPGGAKGLLDEAGSLLLGLPAGAVTGVLDLVKSIVTRPGAPQVELKITRDGVEAKFNPRTLPPDQLATLVGRVQAGLGHGAAG